jgi:hypothetical protein
VDRRRQLHRRRLGARSSHSDADPDADPDSEPVVLHDAGSVRQPGWWRVRQRRLETPLAAYLFLLEGLSRRIDVSLVLSPVCRNDS